MGEVILSTGTKIIADTSKVTRGEWRMFGKLSDDYDAKLIEKLTGISPDEQDKMLMDDFKRIVQLLNKQVYAPLSDPNSPSKST